MSDTNENDLGFTMEMAAHFSRFVSIVHVPAISDEHWA